jgi:RNA polymerase sigma-70 factor (ECF subfamily)
MLWIERAMDYSTHTTLLTRLSEGVDPRAWKEFHDRYVALIRSFARRYGMQPVDCDDVAQEVLLNLSRAMKSFQYDPSKGRFRAYLKTLTLHTIFRNLRQKKDHGPLEVNEVEEKAAATDPEVEAMWEDEWRHYHIRLAMGRLGKEFSEKDRMAFSEYALMDRSATETAESLGLSVDQVYQAKSRILKRLGDLVSEQVKDEG